MPNTVLDPADTAVKKRKSHEAEILVEGIDNKQTKSDGGIVTTITPLLKVLPLISVLGFSVWFGS